MEEKQPEPDYTFDFSKMETTNQIASMHQEGNWLIGVTTLGTSFRHHVPAGKILNKDEGGHWTLQDTVMM